MASETRRTGGTLDGRHGHVRQLIDDFLPDWDERERHEALIAAPPARVEAELRGLRERDLPLTRVLFAIRTLLSRERRDADAPLLDSFQALGFATLAEAPGEELVLGVAGRPWAIRADSLDRVKGPDGFRAYDRPNAIRAAINFRLAPEKERTRVVTETRVQATDERARRTFRRYWRLVMPGSALIRRELLHVLRRLSESDA
jgi:hypothetical protein